MYNKFSSAFKAFFVLMYSMCVMVEELRIQTTRNKIINDFDTVYTVVLYVSSIIRTLPRGGACTRLTVFRVFSPF